MLISNLSELLNARTYHFGSVSSVLDFAVQTDEIRKGCAFFARNAKEANEAVLKGAYCIISEEEFKISDEDIFYLYCENLDKALLRLMRFIAEQKGFEFFALPSLAQDLASAFGVLSLSKNLQNDFALIKNSKEKSLFCADDENYLKALCGNFKALKVPKYELLPSSSYFSSTLLCEDLYFKNLPFFSVYVPYFALFVPLLKSHHLTLQSHKFDFAKVYFVNNKNELCQSSSRAFILTPSVRHFEFLGEALKDIQGFKVAVKNSLFGDFSYNELENLKKFTSFRYCLVRAEYAEFEELFSPQNKSENSLF